ncbi:MAG: heat-inducible transcriptional repressor HrcA [Chloroflexota bacterium]|nr:heat-inducible transcriptional repressor HrcA [Chloroflexota bacterium]
MLNDRKSKVLDIIVGDYIATASPVASEAVARRYPMGVSPATIRNDMADLEEEGYVTHPHTSAGRVPLDKGYRYYVESLMGEKPLPAEEQVAIRQYFTDMAGELEGWARLAARLLSRLVHNAALVTLPKAASCRLQRLELVSLQDFLALMVIVLKEAKLRQQLLSLQEAITQEDLGRMAHFLTTTLAGLNTAEIQSRAAEFSPLEAHVVRSLVEIMGGVDRGELEEPYLDGLSYFLSQPEFMRRAEVVELMGVLEEKSFFKSFLPRALGENGIQAVIGGENEQNALRHCSVVLARYGVPGRVTGVIGVVGPTRMPYDRIFPTVRYLSSVMSGMVAELYG